MDLEEVDGPDSGNMRDCNPRESSAPALPSTDTDGDGFTDAQEIYIGTDPIGRCERTGTAAGASRDWPADTAGGGGSGDRIVLNDITAYTTGSPRALGTKPGEPGFQLRLDINPGTTSPVANAHWIILTDLTSVCNNGPSDVRRAASVYRSQVRGAPDAKRLTRAALASATPGC